jgi:hypothetical protein
MGGKQIFNKTFDLETKLKWKITFQKFDNKENSGYKDIFINGIKFIWSINNKSTSFTNSFVSIKMDLGEDEYINKVIVEEDLDDEFKGPSESQQIFTNLIVNEYEKKKIQKEKQLNDAAQLKKKYEKQLEDEYNDKLIQAVEAYRQMNKIGFYFNLEDDYNGYYRSSVDNYSGNSGQLLFYLKSLKNDDLLKIFDELHDKLKIYHGEATMTMDGPNGMLRSGGRDAMIEKIRHLSFMLKESTKTENKTLGIVCKEQDLSEIFQTDGFQKALQCLTEEKEEKKNNSGQNTVEELKPLDNQEISNLTKQFELEEERDYESVNAREVKGETLTSILEKFNFGGEWEKNGINNIVYDKNTQIVKLLYDKVSLNPNNVIAKKDSIIIWRKGDKEIKESNETQSLKQVKPYEILKSGLKPKKLKTFMTTEEKKIIIENYGIAPTLVSLSSQKDIPANEIFETNDKQHLYSVHTHYLPLDIDNQYSYKIACFQNGFSLNDDLKRSFLGVNTVDSELGFGEVMSDTAIIGKKPNNIQVENNIGSIIPEKVFTPPEILEPVIKYFEPKQGTEDTLIRIVGSKLDKLDYICFRDVKVKILKKQKRVIIENGNKVSYDEYLVKTPTLKELNRECWQSYEPYKVLVWGYFKGTGKQIRSSEVGNPELKMYKYLVNKICPDSIKRKYSPS